MLESGSNTSRNGEAREIAKSVTVLAEGSQCGRSKMRVRISGAGN